MNTRYFMTETLDPSSKVLYWYWTRKNGLRYRHKDGSSRHSAIPISAFKKMNPPVHEVVNPIANDSVFIHRGYQIKVKKDFPATGYLSNGKLVTGGWVVVKNDCNVMPAATWFESVQEAKDAINLLIRVKGDENRFWEVLQPFPYTMVGQKADFQHGSVRKGRFFATVQNWTVTSIRSDLNPNGI